MVGSNADFDVTGLTAHQIRTSRPCHRSFVTIRQPYGAWHSSAIAVSRSTTGVGPAAPDG